jgi:hypothetical protein
MLQRRLGADLTWSSDESNAKILASTNCSQILPALQSFPSKCHIKGVHGMQKWQLEMLCHGFGLGMGTKKQMISALNVKYNEI